MIPEPVLKGDVQIIKAEYGDLETGSVYDVTDDVKSRLKDGVMEVEVSNDLFGDPPRESSSSCVWFTRSAMSNW